MLSAEGYRESLRRYRPRVFVDGQAVESVADEPRLAPGINAIGITYDFALRPEFADVMTAKQATSSWRNYPVGEKVDLVERLLDRGVAAADGPESSGGLASIRRRVSRQPGRCCDAGCDARELHLPPGMGAPPPSA